MPKAILWDADGVALKRTTEYFSQRAAREHGLPLESVTVFFKTTFRLCQIGRADLKDELAKVLPRWGWKRSVDEFLSYWFSVDTPDKEVLEAVRRLREQGVVCCLATDQEKYRAAYIFEGLGFRALFDQCFFSSKLGVSKEDPEFFTVVLSELGLAAGDVRFWDDDQKNVDCAKSVGIDARFYESISDLANL